MYFLIRILHNAAAVLFESCFQPSALPAQPVEPWDCTGIWYIPVTSILIFSLPPFPPSICPPLIRFICYLCFTLLYISLSNKIIILSEGFMMVSAMHSLWRFFIKFLTFLLPFRQTITIKNPFGKAGNKLMRDLIPGGYC